MLRLDLQRCLLFEFILTIRNLDLTLQQFLGGLLLFLLLSLLFLFQARSKILLITIPENHPTCRLLRFLFFWCQFLYRMLLCLSCCNELSLLLVFSFLIIIFFIVVLGFTTGICMKCVFTLTLSLSWKTSPRIETTSWKRFVVVSSFNLLSILGILRWQRSL